MTFSDTIRAARQQAQLSQTDVAERAGITQAQYSKIELGQSTTKIATARAICSVLDLGPPHPAIAFMESVAAGMAHERGITVAAAQRALIEDLKQASDEHEVAKQTFFAHGGTADDIAFLETSVAKRARSRGISLAKASVELANYLRERAAYIEANA